MCMRLGLYNFNLLCLQHSSSSSLLSQSLIPSQTFVGPRHFVSSSVHVHSSSKLSGQSTVPSQILSIPIHFPLTSHLYWSTVQSSCAKIGARRQHSKIVKFKYRHRCSIMLIKKCCLLFWTDISQNGVLCP